MIPRCKTNVLFPEDFAEHIYHIGNVTDMHSITNSGLIPGGMRLRKERQCVFFTAVNPMDEHRFPENARYNLDKARIVADKNEWTVHQNAAFWCDLKLAHKRGIAVLSKADRTHYRAALGSFGSILNQNTHNRWVHVFFRFHCCI